jgi:hypothetical protein
MEFDFGQEYTKGRGVSSVWGDPRSDKWTSQYIVEGETQNSVAKFKISGSSEIVCVYMENQVPVRVTTENQEGLIYRDLTITPVEDVYWLGNVGSVELSNYLKQKVDEIGDQGRTMVVQMEGKVSETASGTRCTGIKISNFYFGVLLDD